MLGVFATDFELNYVKLCLTDALALLISETLYLHNFYYARP